MSNPSFSNIDEWFFELYEGNLSPQQIAQLKSFVLKHPELDVDKDMWEMASVENSALIYPKKDALIRKRPVALYWSLSSAALVLLIIGISLFFTFSNSTVNSFDGRANVLQANRFLNENNNTSTSVNSNDIASIENQLSNSIITSPSFNDQSINYIAFTNSENNSYTLAYQNTTIQINPLSESEFNDNLNELKQINSTKRIALNSKRNYHLKELNRENLIETEDKKEEVIADWKLHRKATTKTSNSNSLSFSMKMKNLQRIIDKMVDNPIALKNLKDPHYHLPGMQAVDVNFGAVGTLLATRVQTTSRYQWMGNQNEQLSNQLLIDGYAYAIRGGVGLQVIQSNYHGNSIQETFAAITYSPKFSVSKNVTVEPAIRYKMGNNRIDPSALQLGQTIEFERNNAKQFYSSTESPKGTSLWFKDIGLSVMVNTKWFFAGAQFDNLARHENNFYNSNSNDRSSVHTVLTFGTDYESVNKNLRFSPYLVYQNYGKLSEAWLGTNFRAKWFTVGAAISSNIEPAASIGVKFKHFALTYNADYTKSMMTSKSALSHQLTLRFNTKPSRIGQRLLNF